MARATKQKSLSSYGKKSTYQRTAGKKTYRQPARRHDEVARSNREYQTGRSNTRYDDRRHRRVPASGRVYYERRKNKQPQNLHRPVSMLRRPRA